MGGQRRSDLGLQPENHCEEGRQALCESLPRGGLGVDAHCRDVGLEDPSKVDDCKPEDTIRDLRAENSRLRAKLKLAGLGCGDECGCSGEGENLEAEQVAR